MPLERLRSDLLFPANRSFLEDAERFGADLRGGEAIDGQLHPREGLLLYVLARRSAFLGDVVEIGSYKGRSTWYLARALADAASPHRVISIDPHPTEAQWNDYRTTLEQHGLTNVETVRGYSHDVAGERRGAVGMLWIDGDHSYAAARRDFEDWFPRLVTGGWYAMHDTVNAWYGPTRLARERLGRRPDLDDVGLVWLTLFGRKVPPSPLVRARGLAARAAFELVTLAQARRNGLGPQAAAPGER